MRSLCISHFKLDVSLSVCSHSCLSAASWNSECCNAAFLCCLPGKAAKRPSLATLRPRSSVIPPWSARSGRVLVCDLLLLRGNTLLQPRSWLTGYCLLFSPRTHRAVLPDYLSTTRRYSRLLALLFAACFTVPFASAICFAVLFCYASCFALLNFA